MVLPNLKRHLKEKNTLSDHDSIHGHRNLNENERSVIARYRNFNAPKICKITVLEKKDQWISDLQADHLQTHSKMDLATDATWSAQPDMFLSLYSRTSPCDHLTKATTWKLRTHNFSPLNCIQKRPEKKRFYWTGRFALTGFLSKQLFAEEAREGETSCSIKSFFLWSFLDAMII